MTQRKVYPGSVVRGVAPAGTIQVIASTGAVDRMGDRIDPQGWKLANYLRNPCVLYGHDYRSLPVGRAEEIAVRDGALRATIRFAADEFSQKVYAHYKQGNLNAVSVGFQPLAPGVLNEYGGVDFKSCELLEISCVPVPALQEALVLARGLAGSGTDDVVLELIDDDAVLEVDFDPASELRRLRATSAASRTGEELYNVDPADLRSAIVGAVRQAVDQSFASLTGGLD